MTNEEKRNILFKINQIYNLEALDALKKIPDKTIDLVFLDPPYNSGKEFGNWKDKIPEEEYEDFIRNIKWECSRVSIKGIGVYLNWKCFSKYWLGSFSNEKILVMDYPYDKSKCHLILTNINRPKESRCLEDIIPVLNEKDLLLESTIDHPAHMPLRYLEYFIEKYSETGDVILDPFMGSGTTAVVCNALGRNFIGFELNKKYVKMANHRLKNLIKKCYK